MLVLVLAFGQLFFGKICRNPTALGWVAWPWSFDRLFATLFVCDSGSLRNRSRLSSASPSSRSSGLLSNHVQLYITVFDCPWLHQQLFVKSAGQSCATLVGWWVGWLVVCWFDQSQPWSVDAFSTVLVIILLSGSRRNHSLRRQMITHPHRTSIRITCAYRGII